MGLLLLWKFQCERYLSVRFPASLVGFAEVESQSVAMFLVQALHDVEGALAQSLTHGVEEDQDQVTEITWGHQRTAPLISMGRKFCQPVQTGLACSLLVSMHLMVAVSRWVGSMWLMLDCRLKCRFDDLINWGHQGFNEHDPIEITVTPTGMTGKSTVIF